MSEARLPEDLIELQIAALSGSIERIEARWCKNGRRTDLSKALRRQRGRWKLYRAGAFAEPPPQLGTPVVVICAPCPSMDESEIEECLTPQTCTTKPSAPSNRLCSPNGIEDETMPIPILPAAA